MAIAHLETLAEFNQARPPPLASFWDESDNAKMLEMSCKKRDLNRPKRRNEK